MCVPQELQDILITLKYIFSKSVLIYSWMAFIEIKQANTNIPRFSHWQRQSDGKTSAPLVRSYNLAEKTDFKLTPLGKSMIIMISSGYSTKPQCAPMHWAAVRDPSPGIPLTVFLQLLETGNLENHPKINIRLWQKYFRKQLFFKLSC